MSKQWRSVGIQGASFAVPRLRRAGRRVWLLGLVVLFCSACSNEPPPHVKQDNQANLTASEKPQNVSGVIKDVQTVTSESQQEKIAEENGHADVELATDKSASPELSAEQVDNVFEDYEAPLDRVALQPLTEGYVEWSAPENVDYSRADLIIVGSDGKRIEASFQPGESMSLSSSLPDGVYSWESVVSPAVDDAVRAEMQAVRSTGNLAAEQELIERLRDNGSLPTEEEGEQNRQSGSFSVINGIARPNFVDSPKELSKGDD